MSELEAMADRLRKVKPDGRDGSHAMLASVAYAVMGGRPGPWSADRCSRLRDTLARLADELARRLRDAEDGPWERAVTAAENVNLRARVAELEDQLEESHAKRRALKAHISKMQSGRHGWHLAYMALVDCLRKHGVEVENDGDRISVEYRREDELCAVVDSMGDVIKRLNAEIARMKGDGHDEG